MAFLKELNEILQEHERLAGEDEKRYSELNSACESSVAKCILEATNISTLENIVQRLRFTVGNSEDLTLIRDRLKESVDIKKEENDSLYEKLEEAQARYKAAQIHCGQLKSQIKSLKEEYKNLEASLRSEKDATPVILKLFKSKPDS